jgi:hypothetical protein
MEKQKGKAYAFFDCKASKETIEGALPQIRSAVETPKQLELSLTENPNDLELDADLHMIAREANEAGIRYVMQATYENATNEQTADELAAVVNQAYQSPLYEQGERFRGNIVYEEKGSYVSR